MDRPKRRGRPLPVKLFCGLLGSESSISLVTDLLKQELGGIDHESELLPFDFTDYYKNEMGADLKRKWVAFRDLKERGYLSQAKHITVRLENMLACNGRRTVNIDPGYVDNAQVVLSTAKNFAHRVYIGMGYYAEVTLVYGGGEFRQLEWTYPDYRSPEGLGFFRRIRGEYHKQVREQLGQ